MFLAEYFTRGKNETHASSGILMWVGLCDLL